MKASWNPAKKTYEIEMTEKELGTLNFALVIAKYETKASGVADLLDKFTKLNDVGAA